MAKNEKAIIATKSDADRILPDFKAERQKEVRFPGIYRYVPRVLENVDILLRFPICAVLALIVLSAIAS
jgi:hypothetical protein